MFAAVHLTVLRIYPFPEPVFQPSALEPISRWDRLKVWQQRALARRRDQKHLDIFSRRDALRSWLTNGSSTLCTFL